MDKKKAIAAGHICLDITPAFKSKEEKSIKDLFRPGQLIAMDAAKVSLGGSVSNTGIGMKRLGADVELMGMVGNDAFGQMVLNELEKYDISPDSPCYILSNSKIPDIIIWFPNHFYLSNSFVIIHLVTL